MRTGIKRVIASVAATGAAATAIVVFADSAAASSTSPSPSPSLTVENPPLPPVVTSSTSTSTSTSPSPSTNPTSSPTVENPPLPPVVVSSFTTVSNGTVQGAYRTFRQFSLDTGTYKDAGAHHFRMQSDGNAVVYKDNTPTWASKTRGAGNFLAFQYDGNVVIYTANGTPKWATNTSSKTPNSYRLTMQSDGNLVLYLMKRVPGSNTLEPTTPIWASHTAGR